MERPKQEFTESHPSSMLYGAREALADAVEHWLAKDPGFQTPEVRRLCDAYPFTCRQDLGRPFDR